MNCNKFGIIFISVRRVEGSWPVVCRLAGPGLTWREGLFMYIQTSEVYMHSTLYRLCLHIVQCTYKPTRSFEMCVLYKRQSLLKLGALGFHICVQYN